MDFVTSTYVSRVGRLGNSLMQIASAIAYGKDHNKKPVFTKWDYQEYIPLEIIPEGTQWNRVACYDMIYEKPEYKSGNVDLHGHFISHKYFSHQRDAVVDNLRLKPEHEKYINEKYGEVLSKENTCSIHVRRNDYLQDEQKNYHGVLEIKYYQEAVRHFPAPNFIICSDDIEWCKEHFKSKDDDEQRIWFIEHEKDIIDLFIMSKCKNNIIANSTFSYWSAFLNQNPNKKVIAPDKFFISGHDKDSYPPNWQTI